MSFAKGVMRTGILALGLGALMGCAQRPRPVPIENDRSIVFPQFFEQDAVLPPASAERFVNVALQRRGGTTRGDVQSACGVLP